MGKRFLLFSRVCLTFVKENLLKVMKRILFLLSIMCFVVLPLMAQHRIGVLLPFQGKGMISQSMVEFYRGVLMAADSMRQCGVSVELYAVDAGTTEQHMQEVLLQHDMSQMDLIIGPGIRAQAQVLGEYCFQHQLPLLMPFYTPYEGISQNPYVFQGAISQDSLYQKAVRMVIDKFKDAHFVLLRSGNYSERGEILQEALCQQFAKYGISYCTLDMQADESVIASSLNIAQRNVIVPDNASEYVLQQSLGMFSRFLNNHPNVRVSLFGFPEWVDRASVYASAFYQLDTYLFSSHYNNPLSGRTIRFKRQYEDNFHQPLSAERPSICMMGYDMGMQILGAERYSPLQNDFHFTSTSSTSARCGSMNTSVLLLHYTPNRLIQIIR